MHMLSRKDLNSPELDTVSSIQKPYNGHDSQRRSANKWGSNSVRQRFGFNRDSTDLRGYGSSSIAGKTLWRSWLFHPIKNAMQLGELRCLSLFRACQPDLPARPRVHRSTSVPQDLTIDDSTPYPANTWSRRRRSPLEDVLRDSKQTTDKK